MWERPSSIVVPPSREYRNPFWGKGSQINLGVRALRKLQHRRNSIRVLKKKIHSVISHSYSSTGIEEKEKNV